MFILLMQSFKSLTYNSKEMFVEVEFDNMFFHRAVKSCEIKNN